MKILVWEVRTSKGFTLMELSKKSGIGKSTINNIENGKVSPTLFQLEMIAIALGVKITDLFDTTTCITLQRDSGSRRNDFHDYGNQPRYFHNDGNI